MTVYSYVCECGGISTMDCSSYDDSPAIECPKCGRQLRYSVVSKSPAAEIDASYEIGEYFE
jgi:predicted nucleic acid-binding Zn ribbon protein